MCGRTTGRFPSPPWWCTTNFLWCTTPPLSSAHPLRPGLGTFTLIPVPRWTMSADRAHIDALWYVCFSINIDMLWIATRTGSTRWCSSSGSPVPINPACCYEHAPQMEISMAPPGRSRPSFEMQRLWKLVALLGVRSFQFLFGNRPSHHMIISFCIWIGIAQLLRSVREWITFGPED